MDPRPLSGKLTSLAGRYAKTLYDLAGETQEVPQIATQFSGFCNFIKSNHDLYAIIFSPALTRHEHKSVFQEVCRKLNLSSTLTNFIQILAENRRLKYIFDIQTIVQELMDQNQNRTNAEIVSAVPLTTKQKENVSAILTNRFSGTLDIHYITDRSLLGGMLVRMGNQIIDLTIVNQLNHLANAMKGSA